MAAASVDSGGNPLSGADAEAQLFDAIHELQQEHDQLERKAEEHQRKRMRVIQQDVDTRKQCAALEEQIRASKTKLLADEACTCNSTSEDAAEIKMQKFWELVDAVEVKRARVAELGNACRKAAQEAKVKIPQIWDAACRNIHAVRCTLPDLSLIHI